MITNRQIGDYVIYSKEEHTAPFFVRMAGADDDEPMSSHQSVTAAVKQTVAYQHADKRRLNRVHRRS